jgi:hypothetical protein
MLFKMVFVLLFQFPKVQLSQLTLIFIVPEQILMDNVSDASTGSFFKTMFVLLTSKAHLALKTQHSANDYDYYSPMNFIFLPSFRN